MLFLTYLKISNTFFDRLDFNVFNIYFKRVTVNVFVLFVLFVLFVNHVFAQIANFNYWHTYYGWLNLKIAIAYWPLCFLILHVCPPLLLTPIPSLVHLRLTYIIFILNCIYYTHLYIYRYYLYLMLYIILNCILYIIYHKYYIYYIYIVCVIWYNP